MIHPKDGIVAECALFVVVVNSNVLQELKRVIEESGVMKEDDKQWPMPDKVGRQELEVVLGKEHISFTVRYCSRGKDLII